MKKVSVFLRLYRNKIPENIVLYLLFSFLSAAVSMVLLVQRNNRLLFQNQLVSCGMVGGISGDELLEGLSFAYQSTENILGLIAVAAMLVGAAGGICLIGFRNQSAEKSTVVMRLFGMQKRDLLIKAWLDVVITAFGPSCLGSLMGYLFFLKFVRGTLLAQTEISLWFRQAAVIFVQTFTLITFIVFLSNLLVDFRTVERPIVQTLYKRKGKMAKQHSISILICEVMGILVYAAGVFHVRQKYLLIAGIVILLVSFILFSLYALIFGVFAKKHRKRKKIHSVLDLSFCFLCSRNKRDALLSIIISVGTILLCIVANVQFNMGGILRSAYQDNMGYTTLIRVDDFDIRTEIQNRLDGAGIGYTYGYSKLMDYSDLDGMYGEEGKFWALVIETQTDGNPHFSVLEHTFLAENYFAGRCNLEAGGQSSLFGSRVSYMGNLEDNQYLSLVSYNFIVNKADWKLGIDQTWNAIFLIDASLSRETYVEELLQGLACHMESASGLIDEFGELMSDYLEVILLVAGMIMLVTAACFYAVIRTDLTARKTEMYLYRIYGASFGRAQRVIFREYTMIALIASFAVSFTIMLIGEFYFYVGLGKHFPLSIPIMGLTTGFAVFFVFLCCQTASYVNAKNVGLEAIRDE